MVSNPQIRADGHLEEGIHHTTSPRLRARSQSNRSDSQHRHQSNTTSPVPPAGQSQMRRTRPTNSPPNTATAPEGRTSPVSSLSAGSGAMQPGPVRPVSAVSTAVPTGEAVIEMQTLRQLQPAQLTGHTPPTPPTSQPRDQRTRRPSGSRCWGMPKPVVKYGAMGVGGVVGAGALIMMGYSFGQAACQQRHDCSACWPQAGP